MLKTGLGFTVIVTLAVSVHPPVEVVTIKYVPAPVDVGSVTALVAAAFVKYVFVPRFVEPVVIAAPVMSTVLGSQTSAGSVMLKTGFGLIVTTRLSMVTHPVPVFVI